MAELKTQESKKDVLETEREKNSQHELLTQQGLLISSNIHVLRKTKDSVVSVDNFFGNGTIDIHLDRKEYPDPMKQAESLFNRAKKMSRGKIQLEKILEQVCTCIEELESQVAILKQLHEEEKVEEVQIQPVITKQVIQQDMFRRYTMEGNILILVGKSAKSNEKLTFVVAKAGDHWLHAREVPGSHVVVNYNGCSDETLCEAALQMAANLAAFHSKSKNDGKVLVMVADPKQLRKPKFSKVGQVRVIAELKSRIGRPNEAISNEILSKIS